MAETSEAVIECVARAMHDYDVAHGLALRWDYEDRAETVIAALDLREDPYTGGRPGVRFVTKDFPRPFCPECGSRDRTAVPQRFRTHGPFCNDEFHRVTEATAPSREAQ